MVPNVASRSVRLVLFTFLFAVSAVSLAGPDKPARGGSGKKSAYAGVKDADQRRSAFEAWKAQHRAGFSLFAPATEGGVITPIVGRASMVINGAGTVLYTKDFLGNSCDVDFAGSAGWTAGTAHAVGQFVHPTNSCCGNQFMATIAGTSGAIEPVWPAAFGSTITDGSITWVNSGSNWLASTAYTTGMVVHPTSPGVYRIGFLYQAQNSGTTAAAPPAWPTTIGGTVVDGGVTWKAIGYYPGSFVGCNAMQMTERASGGSETAIAQEGDLVGQSQLSGWGEFVAMNATGKAAFRAELAGFLRNDDESSAAILTAGPGAGALAAIAKNGDTIGPRFACGFSTMVAMNGAGQVAFDAYGPEHEPTWTANTAFASGALVYATSGKLLYFQANNAGTSGATEPTWPTTPGQTVADGGITWTAQVANCDEDDHAIVRFTTGPGNQVLVAQGSSIGSPAANVIGFGSDDDTQAVGQCGGGCDYQNFDGFVNSAGHVPVVLNLSDGTQGVFVLTGPGTATQAVRLPAGAIGPRASINNGDQVVYRATTGGVDRIFRFTPPSTNTTIASVGDVVNGHTISSFGNFTDINNSGNVVFQAKFAGDSQDGFYYWDGTVTEIVTGASGTLASEMITVIDSNQVAYVTGASVAPNPPGEDASEEHEDGGIFFWTKAGGSTKAIQVGDVINGDAVTTIYAQHTSFAKRQLSSAGCVVTLYHVLGDDPDLDCTEGNVTNGGANPCSQPFNKGGQLFISCAGTVCPTITLAPPTLPAATQGTAYSQSIIASGGAAPYTYAVTTGTLPSGLTLSSGGLLSGTPTVQGTFPFTVTATDANTCTGAQAYSLVVAAPTQVTVAVNPPSRTIVVGTNGNLTVSINIRQSTDTIVTLSSGNPGIVSVPASVTILANQLSASFTANGVSIGGPVTITATLPPSFNATPATAAVTVIAPAAAVVPTVGVFGLVLIGVLLAATAILLLRR